MVLLSTFFLAALTQWIQIASLLQQATWWLYRYKVRSHCHTSCTMLPVSEGQPLLCRVCRVLLVPYFWTIILITLFNDDTITKHIMMPNKTWTKL